jgi:hypothetical protein
MKIMAKMAKSENKQRKYHESEKRCLEAKRKAASLIMASAAQRHQPAYRQVSITKNSIAGNNRGMVWSASGFWRSNGHRRNNKAMSSKAYQYGISNNISNNALAIGWSAVGETQPANGSGGSWRRLCEKPSWRHGAL